MLIFVNFDCLASKICDRQYSGGQLEYSYGMESSVKSGKRALN